MPSYSVVIPGSPKTWGAFGFSVADEKEWIAASIHNPFVAVCLQACGIQVEDVQKRRGQKFLEKANVWVLWQLVGNNNVPGEALTTLRGTMKPLSLPSR